MKALLPAASTRNLAMLVEHVHLWVKHSLNSDQIACTPTGISAWTRWRCAIDVKDPDDAARAGFVRSSLIDHDQCLHASTNFCVSRARPRLLQREMPNHS